MSRTCIFRAYWTSCLKIRQPLTSTIQNLSPFFTSDYCLPSAWNKSWWACFCFKERTQTKSLGPKTRKRCSGSCVVLRTTLLPSHWTNLEYRDTLVFLLSFRQSGCDEETCPSFTDVVNVSTCTIKCSNCNIPVTNTGDTPTNGLFRLFIGISHRKMIRLCHAIMVLICLPTFLLKQWLTMSRQVKQTGGVSTPSLVHKAVVHRAVVYKAVVHKVHWHQGAYL